MKIVLFGDSITDMGRDRTVPIDSVWNLGYGYPFVIASELAKEDPCKYQIINCGISGNRIVDLYARIKADVWNHKPDMLCILVGVNDLGHEINSSNGVEPERFEKVYSMLIEDTLKVLPNLKIVLLEPFILNGTATEEKYSEFLKIKEYAKAVKKLAEKYGLYFIPLQEKFNIFSERYGVKTYLYDGIHPNVAGARLIADEWLYFFKTKFEK